MSSLAIVLFLGTMALSLWATLRVRHVYWRFDQLPASSRLAGAEAAETILRREGIYNVEVAQHNQMLGDHYDPSHKRLVLSRENFHGTSMAALAVVAHECGHGRRGGSGEGTTGSGMDLCRCLHHIVRLLFAAPAVSLVGAQRLTNLLNSI
jgi:Zn-dependent membrane protease YugP